MRVAAIDCGTNSVRLLIAELGDDGRLHEVYRTMQIVRLGHNVDRTGRIDPAALERTFEVVARYAEACRKAGVQRTRMVATSATRDASNREQFIRGVEEILGTPPEIISGDDEAAYSFAGAATVLHGEPAPVLVVDIGGGSTELVIGDAEPSAAISVALGSVRLTERHFRNDPPTAAEVSAAAADIDAALAQAGRQLPVGEARTIVGVAGSITTVTAHALGLTHYDRAAVNGARLTPLQIHRACDELLRAPRGVRETLGFLHPGRIDVIAAGALIWSRVLDWVAQHMTSAGSSLEHIYTSEHDILDGIALSLFSQHHHSSGGVTDPAS